MRRLVIRLSVPALCLATWAMAAPAQAGVPASHLEFLDLRGTINSVYISGPDQNGVQRGECLRTPGRTTISSSWWGNRTNVYTYFGTGCGGAFQNLLWIAPDGGSAYRCLEDVSPFRDYNC
jgi:hypothetical protein